jgi:hypothetical protein
MKTTKLKYQISSPLKYFFIGWNRSHGFFGNLAMFFLGIEVLSMLYIFWRQAID